jgi:hypothetical protein
MHTGTYCNLPVPHDNDADDVVSRLFGNEVPSTPYRMIR